MNKIVLFILLFLISFINGFSENNLSVNPPLPRNKIKKVYNSKAALFKILKLNQKKTEFEIDTTYGYIKSGFLFNATQKSAVIICFDSIWKSSLLVYEFKNDNWVETFYKDSIGFNRDNGLKAFIKDFNFDGKKDIAFLNEMSSGAAILTLKLWLQLSENKFKYIPEFEEIGTPAIDIKNKTIQGFTSCCVSTEITLTDYYWVDFKIIKKHSLFVTRNYILEVVETVEKFFEYKNNNNVLIKQQKIKISSEKINNIIKKFEKEWNL